jgi:transcriptional regulator with GAF, ATPase, and Fis domain
MQPLLPTLLDAWREAGRHLEIGEAVAEVAPLLARRLPLDLLVVRAIDVGRSFVETVAASAAEGDAPRALRSELDAHELDHLLAWCRDGRPIHRRAKALSAKMPGALPDGVDGDVLLGPLLDGRTPIGLLALVAKSPHSFSAEHAPVASALLEPFAFALSNDRRLRSAETLREAAEADRRALLSKLGRSDLRDATIVGSEAGFRPVMERVELAAPSDVPVLILGETGAGKEVVARAIHQRSQRAAAPFVRVNCGAIPAGLIDSELFGHERGSFTGAASLRKGWFERADGGTLFLDEVGELPAPAQVRLLRILQDGSFERVGGERALHVDVRIVAATHRDLRAMVGEGTFREDLWYRLAVFPIDLPPLRERPEDIPALANHFALRAATRFGTPPRIPTPEDLELLVAYPWPGNVRELAAVIERAVILGNGERLELATAIGVAPPPTTATPLVARASAPSPRGGAAPAREAPFPTLDQAMALHIEAALERTRGKIEGPGGAAALLDINPHTLRARMRKLGVDWGSFRG